MPPWEKYVAPVEPGPWSKYGQTPMEEPETPSVPAPTMGEVALNAIPKGLANLANTPVAIWNLAKAGAAAMHPQIKEEATPTPNYPMMGMEKIGAYDPNKEPQTPIQRIIDTAIQGAVATAAAPASGIAGIASNLAIGAASGAAAATTKELTGSELLAIAAGALTPFALRRPMVNINPVKKETLQDAQSAGYVVQPSTVKPTFTTNRLESVAGKAAVAQDAALRNQEVTNRLAAKAIGLPEETPITMGTLEAVREKASEAYKKINDLLPGGGLQSLKVKTIEQRPMMSGPSTGLRVRETRGALPETSTIDTSSGLVNVNELRDESGRLIGLKTASPTAPLEGLKVTETSRGQNVPGGLQGLKVSVQETRATNKLEELKQLRADASLNYQHYARSADPKSLRKANLLSAKASAIENEFEKAALASGQPELVDQFKAARQLIARTYDIEKALNLSDGNVSAQVIGRLLDQGKPLTGELRVIGKFAQAFPRVAREGSMVPPAGVSGTDSAASALLGVAGYGVGGPAGIAAAGLPLLRAPARNIVLGQRYQSSILREGTPLYQAAIRGGLSGTALIDYYDAVEK